MTTPAQALLSTLVARGVAFSIPALGLPAEALHYVAPPDALTPTELAALRQYKLVLLVLVEVWDERAAIMEYGAGLSRPDAERDAWHCVLGQPLEASV